MQAEREVGRGEDRQRFDQDIRGCFIASEVRVELVPANFRDI